VADAFDVIVVGVGSMGAAACHELSRRGARVLGLEQGPLPNPLASFTGATRAIRLSYAEHADYVPLLRGACERWETLGEECGRRLLQLTGALYLGPPEGELVSGARRSAEEHDLAHTLHDHADLQKNWPQFQLPENFVGLHEGRAGYLLSEQAVAAYIEGALRHGADLRGHQIVTGWSASESGVTVQTAGGEFHAGHLVFTAGAWTGKLLFELGVRLKVTRQVLGWVWPSAPDDFTADKFPVWVVDGNEGAGVHYGFPITPDGSGGVGLKLALHWPSTETNPDTVEREALPGDEGEIRDGLRRFIPTGDGPLLSLRVCLYTNSPDGHFIVDRHPEHSRVSLACGFSGHGFKFASIMGEVLADLASAGKTDWPIGFLGLSRFDS
jgi:sarcosine oxidase